MAAHSAARLMDKQRRYSSDHLSFIHEVSLTEQNISKQSTEVHETGLMGHFCLQIKAIEETCRTCRTTFLWREHDHEQVTKDALIMPGVSESRLSAC